MHSASWSAALAAALCTFSAYAADPIFRFEDVRGDDYGSGGIIYPNRPDMKLGDLDLVAVSARADRDGAWFSVEMAQPIRNPSSQVSTVGQIPLGNLARHGFYTFNVDLYIDQDRKPGSGRTDAAPGRKVAISRDAAWERAVILSPRPEVARSLLLIHYAAREEAELRAKKGNIKKAELQEIERRVEKEINERFYFPNRIRVASRTVEFFAPTSFFGAPISADWAYSVCVTGADIEQLGRVDFNPTNRPQMMTMPVERGIKDSTFGLRSDADLAQSPVIDVLVNAPGVQARALEDFDSVSGRLAVLPIASATPAVVAPAADAQPAPAAKAPIVPPTTETAGAAARLRALNDLLEQGLITQQEYAELRRKVLAEL